MPSPPSGLLPACAASAPWNFEYEPVCTSACDDDGEACDVVVASREPLDESALRKALQTWSRTLQIDVLLSTHPLYWSRVRSPDLVRRDEVRALLDAAGVPVRYVASAQRSSSALADPLDLEDAVPATGDAWPSRSSGPAARETSAAARWFLGEKGLSIDRACCGSGEGTRLAVIDDDAADSDFCCLDGEVPILVDKISRAQAHGSLMVAWAVGTRSEGGGFRGVAPAASARLYCIPKPGIAVVGLPLAVVRAVREGADVVLCSTYVEGCTSPMLDDALEYAVRKGRAGRGSIVVMPTGREATSPPGSVHASWSLGLGEPASDPRVACISPSSRTGGWFLWRDRCGLLRPFSNRGPAVRFLAPGDDLPHPFSLRERSCHAESSGASALAAGTLLLLLGRNPSLRWQQALSLLTSTLDRVDPNVPLDPAELADPFDMHPLHCDPDLHNSKHGYGRLNATRACLAASDPLCAALGEIGEDAAARSWWKARQSEPRVRELYSSSLGRWMCTAISSDLTLSHALKTVLRHLRLVADSEKRQRAHAPGALLRHLGLLLRALLAQDALPKELRLELSAKQRQLAESLDRTLLEQQMISLAQFHFSAPLHESDS